jgi:predicted ATP-dependent endonuclease of OLD family
MFIKEFLITNFRSIRNSGRINVEKDITTLIGKNESGKSNILKALSSFDDEYEYGKEDLCTYSDAYDQLDRGEIEESDIPVIEIRFGFEEKDKEKIEEIHNKLAKLNEIVVTKYFDNHYVIDLLTMDFDELNMNEEISKRINQIEKLTKDFREKLEVKAKESDTLANLWPSYKGIISNMESYEQFENKEEINSDFKNFFEKLRKLSVQDKSIKNVVESFIKETEILINEILEMISEDEDEIFDKIIGILPRFMYFNTVEELEDKVPITKFTENLEDHKTLYNLTKLASLNIDKLNELSSEERETTESHAEATIRGMINKSWTQEKVTVKLRLEPNEIAVFVKDNTGASDPPSRRSEGFKWFLSFYINFMAESDKELKNTIILLDDPGVYLHPSGQKDLMKTLEEITKDNQIIFSTHSPFLIDRKKLNRIRIVSKEEKGKGTKIKDKFYKSDYDALQPIRASIGMTMGDSLFIDSNNILVEGFSDWIILEAFNEQLLKLGKKHLVKASFLPVNGADKMPYFSTILANEKIDFVILLDYDAKGRRTKKELIEEYGIDESLILLLNEAINGKKGKEIVIEDLIDFNLYLEAVNQAYKEIFIKKLKKKEMISPTDLNYQRFSSLNGFFKTNKLKRVDKIKVAKHLAPLLHNGREEIDETMFDRFEKLFIEINKRLKGNKN